MNVHHNQMSRGSYSAAIKSIFLPGLAVALTSYGPAITSQGTPFKGRYGLALPLSPIDGVYFNHRSLQDNEIGVVAPGDEFHLYRPPGFRCITFFPDAALMDRRSEAMFGTSFVKLCRASPAIRATDGAVGACARHFAQLCDKAMTDEEPLRDWIAASGGPERLARECIDDVLGIVYGPEPIRGWSGRQRILDRAWEIIEDDDDGLVTVSDLCARLRVPIRTLDDAFHACIGITPKRFVLGVRLNKARRALGRAGGDTSITSTATRFGFFHFGHFSGQYLGLFGELPSETLHRARAGRSPKKVLRGRPGEAWIRAA